MKKINIIIVFSFFSLVFSSTHAKYFVEQVNKGKTDQAIKFLDSLLVNFPNDVSVIYLEALLSKDGDKSFENYKKIFELYPDSQYADEALMSIGEYYYARGLYSQSAAWLKKIPLYYSRSEMVENSVHLFLNSLKVMGYTDTAIFYSKVFKKQFPDISFNLDVDLEKNEKVKEVKDDANKESKPIKIVSSSGYGLQIGAFSYLKNADKERKILESIGYNVVVDQIEKNKRILHVVRIGYYKTKEEAESAKVELKKNLGKDSFVIKK